MTTAALDYFDTFYLANSLTIKQLRAEIHDAEVQAAVADTFRDTEYQTEVDSFPFADYVDICQKAMQWQQQSTPKQTHVTGHIDIEAIKATNDIVAVIERYTKLPKTGKNFTGCCPIHQDKNPSLTVYPDQQSWHCFGCNRGGDVIAFIQEIEHTDFRGAAAVLGGR